MIPAQDAHDAIVDGELVTYPSRTRVTPLWPTPEQIVIEDIARALSLQCRFLGHLPTHYSVAQHAIFVSCACAPEDALWGLLHDASEAYLGDVPSPLKRLPQWAAYRAVEAALQAAIYARFGLTGPEPPSVHEADRLLLTLEEAQIRAAEPPAVIQGLRVRPWRDHAFTERQFLRRFAQLTAQSAR